MLEDHIRVVTADEAFRTAPILGFNFAVPSCYSPRKIDQIKQELMDIYSTWNAHGLSSIDTPAGIRSGKMKIKAGFVKRNITVYDSNRLKELGYNPITFTFDGIGYGLCIKSCKLYVRDDLIYNAFWDIDKISSYMKKFTAEIIPPTEKELLNSLKGSLNV